MNILSKNMVLCYYVIVNDPSFWSSSCQFCVKSSYFNPVLQFWCNLAQWLI